MSISFSASSRSALLKELSASPLDLLIIGGGITGAGILLDATARGMRAAVVEMQDFAAGTSNRSTKLVHGGLRYLKQLEVGLVAEVGKERAIVYENGPHITTPTWMLLPMIPGGTYGWWATSFGIYLYDRLAGVKHSERRKMLHREDALAKEPLLRPDIRGAGYYVEYRTDDARLTLEILKAAVARGGVAVNYARAEQLLYADGRVTGARVRDQLTGQAWEVRAKKVVNAAGPWVDELREWDKSKTGKTLHHTKGVHIVVDGNRFPLHNAVYFDVPDGRMVFAIPRDGKTYIGTTDTNYTGDLVRPRMTTSDVSYLCDCVNFMFPSVNLTPADVESGWAGVRPLIHEAGKSPSEISRRDEVFVSPSGLISIAGGKLTGYRKMADKVVSLVARDLTALEGRQFTPCTTAHISYSGGDVGGSAGYPAFVRRMTEEGVRLGLDRVSAEQVARTYGSNTEKVWEVLAETGDKAEAHGLPPALYARLLYGLAEEMVVTPSDFFVRRTGMLYFDIAGVRRYRAGVLAAMADRLGWDTATRDEMAAELERSLADTAPIPEAAERAGASQGRVWANASPHAG
ncbi:FAD-dependent oxidoreductase [Alicyclobacillus herbarius]|uniref:glycerol-3-phosphate dehydrogenase/oxidase n=1 Tax=Alicyclobacillus herbarius TaxID=122960 RepID=UPI00041E04D4